MGVPSECGAAGVRPSLAGCLARSWHVVASDVDSVTRSQRRRVDHRQSAASPALRLRDSLWILCFSHLRFFFLILCFLYVQRL